MAKFVGQYVQDKLVGWLFGSAMGAAPTAYAALCTTAPTAIDGTGLVEVSGGSYARQAVGSAGATSTNGAGTTAVRQASASGTITFPQASANWGTIVGVAFYDAPSAGNLLGYGDLTASQVVNSGNTFVLSAGNLTLQA
jgi:hypothetical protein